MEFAITSAHTHFMVKIHTVLFCFVVGKDIGALAEGMIAAAVFGGEIQDGGGEGGGVA